MYTCIHVYYIYIHAYYIVEPVYHIYIYMIYTLYDNIRTP